MSNNKSNICVFIQQDREHLADVSLELVGKARELAGILGVGVEGILIGKNLKKMAAELVQYGVDRVFCVQDKRLENYTPVPYAKIVTRLVSKYKPQIVLYGATPTGRDVAPRVASALRVGLTADCTDLQIGDHTFKEVEYKQILLQIRPAFGGNIIATIVSPGYATQMATVREGVMHMPEKGAGYKGEIIEEGLELEKTDFPTEVLEILREERKVNLKSAQIIVAGGMGVGSKENFELLRELADVLGAQLAASRAAVDAGFISKEHQVGQTGVTVRPRLYIACGISGSVQHRAGMQESGRIIAINTDREAPIFGVAHYGIVGDYKDVIPRLIKAYRLGT
ncbi:MAG: electron transfer flavoprotein subunit alpha/FixB family protein [Planctomycetes bacterium]|nr:electron transfer flavoprotein subunit alpha/FixB family protein [Planctomycetota bacterium]